MSEELRRESIDDAMDVDVIEAGDVPSSQTSVSQMIDGELPLIQSNDDLKVDDFFEQVLKSYSLFQTVANLAFITVNHIVRTLPPYLKALSKIGRIAAVIPKASCKDQKIYNFVCRNYNLETDVTKEQLRDTSVCSEFIKRVINPDEKLIIIDIGGYFAAALPNLEKNDFIRESLLGIVEDTENGFQKYENVISESQFPVVSVARSFLKETEDYNVGKSIVRAADGVLRRDAHTLQERFKYIGVIGVGKIGFSIAQHLQREVGKVYICELNPQRAMYASSKGIPQVSKDEILENADLIFSATGNKGLRNDDFFKLRNNVFIASVTSADDELDIESLKTKSQNIYEENNITKYTLENKSEINLLYDGNAINFVDGAVNGPFIYSVQAELLVCALQLARNQYQKKATNLIYELASADMSRIAAIWNQIFDGNLTWTDQQEFAESSVKASNFVATDVRYINQSIAKQIFNIPAFTIHFAGRLTLKAKISTYLGKNDRKQLLRPYVISGMGGVGKTQLALHCVWDQRDLFTNCFYINAENEQVLQESFQKIAGLLKLENKPLSELVPAIYEHLAKRPRSLLLFDEVPNKEFIKPYLPPNDCGYSSADFAILITSRSQTDWNQCEKLLMDPERGDIKQDGVAYLMQNLNCNKVQAEKLADTVHYLPLALSQLVAYIQMVKCPIDKCLEILKLQNKSRSQVLKQPSLEAEDENETEKHKRTVLTLWNLSMQAIAAKHPQAKKVMHLAAYLYADRIQYDLFKITADLILPLQNFSLIYRIDDTAFRMHRLLQEVIRDVLREQQASIYEKLIDLLADYAPYYRRNNIAIVSAAYLHYQTMRSYPAVKLSNLKQAKLVYALAAYVQDRHYDYQQSLSYLEQASSFAEQEPDFSIKVNRLLAKAYFRTGQIDKAEKFYLALMNSKLPDVVINKVKIDYCLFLQAQKKSAEAKNILTEITEAKESLSEDKARAYYYLAQDNIRYVRNLNKTITEAKIKISVDLTINLQKHREYILGLEEKLKTTVHAAIQNFKQSLAIKQENNDHLEILRTSLRLIEFVNNGCPLAMVKKIVKLTADLYLRDQGFLQHLERDLYQREILQAGVALAHLFNHYPSYFEALNVTKKIKEILDEHKSWIEEVFGKETPEYKEFSEQFEQKQKILGFQPGSGATYSTSPSANTQLNKTVEKSTIPAGQAKFSGFSSAANVNAVTKSKENSKKRGVPLDEETSIAEETSAAKKPKNIEVIIIDDSDDEAENKKVYKPGK